jgi:hypothetical protein
MTGKSAHSDMGPACSAGRSREVRHEVSATSLEDDESQQLGCASRAGCASAVSAVVGAGAPTSRSCAGVAVSRSSCNLTEIRNGSQCVALQ